MYLIIFIVILILIALFLALALYAVLKEASPIVEPPLRSQEERAYFSAFSSSYFEARKKFRDAAKNANAKLSSHLICIDQMTGLDLTIDIAVLNLPPQNNKKKIDLIVHLSATHGVEGYAGSAVQIRALENISNNNGNNISSSGDQNYDPSKPTIVFIHAVNPFGMANFRRFNENNVDLNRNCITTTQQWNEVMSRTPNQFGYESFRHLLCPRHEIMFAHRFSIFVAGVVRLVTVGLPTLKKVFVTGQYHDPTGTYYGGNGKLERNWTVIRDVMQPLVLQARRLITIDVHSGLGPCGVDSMMTNSKEEYLVSRDMFPTRDRTIAPLFSYPGADGASSGYEHTRGFTTIAGLAYPDESEEQLTKRFDLRLETTQEFGTLAPLFVARGVICENASFQMNRGSPSHRMTQEMSRAAFYVETYSWKDNVLRRGLERLDQAVEYLKSH